MVAAGSNAEFVGVVLWLCLNEGLLVLIVLSELKYLFLGLYYFWFETQI